MSSIVGVRKRIKFQTRYLLYSIVTSAWINLFKGNREISVYEKSKKISNSIPSRVKKFCFPKDRVSSESTKTQYEMDTVGKAAGA